MKNWPFALWGADGSDDDGGSDDSTDESTDDSTDTTTVTMTQAELNKSIARAASRASRKATKELRESLGFKTHEDLTSFVTDTRTAQESEKTEAEKLQAQLEEAQAAVESDRRAARSERINLAIDRAIVSTGITDEAKTKRIRTLVKSELGDDLDIEKLSDEVTDALTAVKTDVPSMFETSTKNQGSGDGGTSSTNLSEDDRNRARDEKWEEEFRKRGLVATP